LLSKGGFAFFSEAEKIKEKKKIKE